MDIAVTKIDLGPSDISILCSPTSAAPPAITLAGAAENKNLDGGAVPASQNGWEGSKGQPEGCCTHTTDELFGEKAPSVTIIMEAATEVPLVENMVLEKTVKGGASECLEVLKVASASHSRQSDEDSVCADIDRWASSSFDDSCSQVNNSERLHELETEQQRLNDAVLLLSTNFAQFQLRLQQINMAPKEGRDAMLKELQEFASRGCVDVAQVRKEAEELKVAATGCGDNSFAMLLGPPDTNGTIHQLQHKPPNSLPVEERRDRVQRLIAQLREQLEGLERFAYEHGDGEIPLSELRRKQKLVFDKLQEKMCFKIELDKWTEKELGRTVDANLEQILTPMREKDELLEQLQTQIVDLERFVALLQQECNAQASSEQKKKSGDAGGRYSRSNSESPPTEPQTPLKQKQSVTTPMMLEMSPALSPHAASIRSLESTFKGRRQSSLYIPGVSGRVTDTSLTNTILRLFACRSQRAHFTRNQLKQTPLGNHYGDQRAQLELAVDLTLQVLAKYQILTVERGDDQPTSPPLSESYIVGEGDVCPIVSSPLAFDLTPATKCDFALPPTPITPSFTMLSDEPIVAVVRKEFCPALKALLSHGLRPCFQPMPKGAGRTRVPELWPPANNKSYPRPGQQITHVWDVVLFYYECAKWSEQEAGLRTLSAAYRLDATPDGRMATSKQVLLATIERVATTHLRHKRSLDSMWKAFVSAALNQRRLPAWVRMVFREQLVVANCYYSWAYVARTGCEEMRPLLEKLHAYNFDLPVDLACRPFEHIREAF